MATLHPLTSLRFFAALGVLLVHSLCFNRNPERMNDVLCVLISGVTFFFVLSGFILAYVYAPCFGPMRGKRTWDFLVARFARIYPLHLLTFAACLGVTAAGAELLSSPSVGLRWRTLANLTLTMGYGPDTTWVFAYNIPAWSLSAEATFYLSFPLLAAGLASSRWWLRGVTVLVACAGLARGWVQILQHGHSHPDTMMMALFPPTRYFEFLCGVLLGAGFRRWQARHAGKPYRAGVWTMLECGAVAAVGLSLAVAGKYSSAAAMPTLTWNGYFLPGFLLCIWVFAVGRGRLSRWLSTRPLIAVGEASFALYMIHFPLILLALKHLDRSLTVQNKFWALFVLANIAVSLLIRKRQAVAAPTAAAEAPLKRAA